MSFVDFDMSIGGLAVGVRLLLASLLSAVIGLEREVRGKDAGLRTHMMVGLGSAAFTLAAFEASATVAEIGRPDPTRIIQGIVGGIGFLGAGQIIQSQGSVQGMTTAASIWVVGSVGVACGAGYHVLAGLTVLIAFAVLTAVNVFEERLIRNSRVRKQGKRD